MRKAGIAIGVLWLVAGLCATPYAGGIINKQNWSAEYLRTLNRNAATDMADAAAFNPAGTALMKDGLYLKADGIYLMKDYSNELPSSPAILNLGTLDSEEPSIIPGLFAVYKKDRWAGFFAVTIPGGGGYVRFDDGNARTAMLSLPGALGGLGTYLGGPTGNPTNIDQFIEADSYYVGYSLGASYRIFDTLALGGGIRYVDASQTFKGKAQGALNSVKVKIERTDEAFNYFLGLNWMPIPDLTFAATYMSNTPLNFKSDTKDNSPGAAVSRGVGWTDGTHEREDLPGYISLGLSYFIIPGKLRIEPNLNYYLEKQAKLEGRRFQDSMPGNSMDYGVTLEYILNPQWRFSVGYLRTDIKGMDSPDLLPEAPELDANTIAAGFVWSPTERLSLSLGGLRVWYESEKVDRSSSRAPAGTTLDKDVWGLAVGLQYRFF